MNGIILSVVCVVPGSSGARLLAEVQGRIGKEAQSRVLIRGAGAG